MREGGHKYGQQQYYKVIKATYIAEHHEYVVDLPPLDDHFI